MAYVQGFGWAAYALGASVLCGVVCGVFLGWLRGFLR